MTLDNLALLSRHDIARPPGSFAGESYTLREHVDFVRRAVLARAAAGAARPAAPGSAVTAMPTESR